VRVTALLCLEPKLLPLGQTVATPGALDLLDHAGVNAAELLARHQSGDWGELSAEDRAQNDRAVNCGERVLSNYPIREGERIWIITEWDRSVTTLLLPSEY
jgi:hypothetical protein